MKSSLLLAFILSISVPSGSSDAPLQATVLTESRVAISGTSTINRFECEADGVQGLGRFDQGRAEARVTVPVEAFDCGQGRMNRDLRTAMKASRHPEIRFVMTDAERLGSGEGNVDRVRVRGLLTIAGETREVDIEAIAERRPDGTYRAQGSDELRMSDFGITPPTALAGLIRAHDQIVVHFDLMAATNVR